MKTGVQFAPVRPALHLIFQEIRWRARTYFAYPTHQFDHNLICHSEEGRSISRGDPHGRSAENVGRKIANSPGFDCVL